MGGLGSDTQAVFWSHPSRLQLKNGCYADIYISWCMENCAVTAIVIVIFEQAEQ